MKRYLIKASGVFIISLPFVVVFVGVGIMEGWWVPVIIFSFVFFVIAYTMIGLALILND